MRVRDLRLGVVGVRTSGRGKGYGCNRDAG